jgi:hypothetical protein
VVFGLVHDDHMLLAMSGGLLLILLLIFRDPGDLASVVYAAAVGFVWERVGTSTGQWSYPQLPPGGIPPWFATLFGSIGLFARHLVWRFTPDASLTDSGSPWPSAREAS